MRKNEPPSAFSPPASRFFPAFPAFSHFFPVPRAFLILRARLHLTKKNLDFYNRQHYNDKKEIGEIY
jgi:hypothetical protein